MSKAKKRGYVPPVVPGDQTNNSNQDITNPAIINPQAVDANTRYDTINYEPGTGWVAPKSLKELLRENKEKHRK